MIVIRANSAQRTRYHVLNARAPVSLGLANTKIAFAVALVNISWREKLELLQVAELTPLRSFPEINTSDPRR